MIYYFFKEVIQDLDLFKKWRLTNIHPLNVYTVEILIATVNLFKRKGTHPY